MKELQTTQDGPALGDGQVEGPVMTHQQEVVDEVHRGKLGEGATGPEPVHDQHRDRRLGVTLAGARHAAPVSKVLPRINPAPIRSAALPPRPR